MTTAAIAPVLIDLVGILAAPPVFPCKSIRGVSLNPLYSYRGKTQFDEGEAPPQQSRYLKEHFDRQDQDKETRGHKPALWAQCMKMFPAPEGVKPDGIAAVLRNKTNRTLLCVPLMSSTWQNPANAQYNRRKIFFNLIPRIEQTIIGDFIYRMNVAADDWSDKVRENITDTARRHDAELIWFNNAASIGAYVVFSNKPQKKGEWHALTCREFEVDLEVALEDITPSVQLDGKRVRYYGGTDGWASGLMKSPDEAKGVWQLRGIGRSGRGEMDYALIEVTTREHKISTIYAPKMYWRSQAGDGILLLNIKDDEDEDKLIWEMGFIPVGRKEQGVLVSG